MVMRLVALMVVLHVDNFFICEFCNYHLSFTYLLAWFVCVLSRNSDLDNFWLHSSCIYCLIWDTIGCSLEEHLACQNLR